MNPLLQHTAEIASDYIDGLADRHVGSRAPDGGDADAFTDEVIRRVQDDGTCWLGGSTWHGRQVMRISVSNWSTTEADIDRSADAILRCAP